MAVVRTGGGFGVVLDRESVLVAVPDSGNGVIVEVAVGDFKAIGQLLVVDRESMILGRDFDLFRFPR